MSRNTGPEPWLSVVMPVHNGEAYLATTLDSVAAQDTGGIEFLVLDSSDDGGASAALLERYSSRLTLRYLALPQMKPWTAKTNHGVELAAAAHVAMLHQDDLWLDGHAKAAQAAIAEAPEASLLVGPSRYIDSQGRDVGAWGLPFPPGQHTGKEFLSTLIVQNTIAIPSPIIRREAWLACGGLLEDLWYTADWDLYLKLASAGSVVVRPRATTAFRLHAESLTMTGSRDLEAFRSQLEVVLERHGPAVPAACRSRQLKLASAAILVNCALVEASQRKPTVLFRAVLAILRLGPIQLGRFIRQTRLVDRVLPRLHLVRQRWKPA